MMIRAFVLKLIIGRYPLFAPRPLSACLSLDAVRTFVPMIGYPGSQLLTIGFKTFCGYTPSGTKWTKTHRLERPPLNRTVAFLAQRMERSETQRFCRFSLCLFLGSRLGRYGRQCALPVVAFFFFCSRSARRFSQERRRIRIGSRTPA